ncbi:MAG: hypothetical protein HRT44_08830 [Bdellovibrionales bacterium]|nr:hypothetical protein [Bdellovibrionales bacterium]NQZ19345.1 hypothetical protein [Bdellovibrionales bacterium]
MRLKSFRFIFSILMVTLVAIPGFANDPAQTRARFIELSADQYQTNEKARTLREKIRDSRALLLYMQDILPAKGNPYYHMADFSSKSTLEIFKAAQKNASSHMNSKSPLYWLPIDGAQVESADLADADRAAVINYFAQFVATADIMKNVIQPRLSSSIIIGSLEETTNSEVKEKFDRAWSHIQFWVTEYRNLLSVGASSQLIEQQNKKVMLLIMDTVAEGMKPYLDYFQTDENRTSLNQFFERIDQLATKSPSSEKAVIKAEAQSLTDTNSNLYKEVNQVLATVDLPDTSDIDGSEESFEIAMRLQIGFDLLKTLLNEMKEKW